MTITEAIASIAIVYVFARLMIPLMAAHDAEKRGPVEDSQ